MKKIIVLLVLISSMVLGNEFKVTNENGLVIYNTRFQKVIVNKANFKEFIALKRFRVALYRIEGVYTKYNWILLVLDKNGKSTYQTLVNVKEIPNE